MFKSFFAVIFIFFTLIEIKADEYPSITKILADSQITFNQKYDLLKKISKLELSEQQKALSILLAEAKRQKQVQTLCELYSLIAHNDLFLGDINQTKLTLDSASIFIKNVTDNNTIALYHYVSGDYYNTILDEANAHRHYYEAIRYYEQSNKGHLRATYILHNIAFSYIQKKDLSNLKIVRDRMKTIRNKADKNISIEVAFNRVQAYYYSILYQKEAKECYLDSAIILDKKVINLFESDIEKKLRPEEIAYNYVDLVSNSLKKKDIDYNQLEPLINCAVNLAIPTDTAMKVNCLWLKGLIYIKQDKWLEAETILKEQLILMKNWSVSENLVMYADLYKELAKISITLNKYKEAFTYQQEELKYRKQILDKEKYLIISDLQTKYETEKKEDKYLDKLETIDKDSIFILENKELNDLRIQYCMCFGIGMKKEHISLCYNIVDQTIRKHRSTIKADLELEKDDDLDIYLVDLFNGNIY